MKVSAFTYVRNGLELDYPFVEAIKSVLPLVNECIVVLGDSYDGSREAVTTINDTKIKILDTIWDDGLRQGGTIFAQQSNIGLEACDKEADWLLHIQADEVLHEKDYANIKQAMQDNLHNTAVEGLLFNFINFFGDYKHYGPSRRFHHKEIRIIRNNKNIRSYRDSQGFRRFNDTNNIHQEKGFKLNVKQVDATVFHYSYVKNPATQFKKQVAFGNRWETDDSWVEKFEKENKGKTFDYESRIDYLYLFKDTHPAIMQTRIAAQDWTFTYKGKGKMSLKEKVHKVLQDITGKQLFSYKNYREI